MGCVVGCVAGCVAGRVAGYVAGCGAGPVGDLVADTQSVISKRLKGRWILSSSGTAQVSFPGSTYKPKL